ncbi:MAG: UDP-N-acetylmuramoyl-tripeptide--D-alanyl-D-alanine ligase [Alistipes sp.]|nr:UDP-N-acetylmuramoyl-tripeptide--D-alanyl-D-alanine ligase [Alistipes sp.]
MDINRLYTLFQTCFGVTTDSRKIGGGEMFFALRGESFDGNKFAVKALQDGAAYAVIDSKEVAESNPELSERLLLCSDTLTTLQNLAAEHRRRLSIPIIAIVGSNGKTTTKELVSRVLAEKFRVYATRGNLNNHIGVPLTLLAMDSSTEFGVVEMGASACEEIAMLCSIAQPNYGIITNIGNAHLGGFGGYLGVIKGKGELYDYLNDNGGKAFVAQEDDTLTLMAAARLNMAVEPYFYSLSEGYKSHLSGDYNLHNIAAAVAIGRYFEIAPNRIASAIESYIPDNNRSQEVITRKKNRLIIDCYNANPSSMEAALENISSMAAEQKLLILGDMLELGEWSCQEHTRILTKATNIDNAEIVLVGEEFRRAAHILGIDVSTFATTAEAMLFLENAEISNTTILLKGSRGITLEKLIDKL